MASALVTIGDPERGHPERSFFDPSGRLEIQAARLTLADVHAALAYFYDHREAIVGQWQERDLLFEAMQKEFPAPPARPRSPAS